MIELRSDTFTLPSERMLAPITSAPLGNDGYGEDPTVNRLERLAAERVGKEAACLRPSGTMANLAARDQLPAGRERPGRHAAASRPGGWVPRGPDHPQFARPAVICLENTQNRCGAVILPQEYQAAVAGLAKARGVPVHLDGARLFNAATGDGEFIAAARRIRKMLGGGMRQAGVIAAAGIAALEDMAERLAADHALARRLAAGRADLPDIEVYPVFTNIVLFRPADPGYAAEQFVAAARRAGLAVAGFGHGRIRAVTHVGVTAADIDRAVEIVRTLLAAGPPC